MTYNVTLSDGTAELVEERTTTSNTISFTDLDNDTQYEVTVLAINNAGPATVVTVNANTLTPSGWLYSSKRFALSFSVHFTCTIQY